jgi:hypothetical protein
MVDTLDTVDSVESLLIGEIARVSAKRARLLERSMGAVRSPLTLDADMMLMGIEIDEAREAILSDDPARAIRALYALRRFDAYD